YPVRNCIGLRFAQHDSGIPYPQVLVNLASASNFFVAAPESIERVASGTASATWSAVPAATSAAAQLSKTTSRWADLLPLNTARIISAFSAASPPLISARGAHWNPNSSGGPS